MAELDPYTGEADHQGTEGEPENDLVAGRFANMTLVWHISYQVYGSRWYRKMLPNPVKSSLGVIMAQVSIANCHLCHHISVC